MKTRYPLPAWAKPHDVRENEIIVDPDEFYPALLKEIAEAGIPDNAPPFPPLDLEKPGRYWIEVAYQFMKMDLQFAIGKFGFSIIVLSDGPRKGRWSLKAFPNICPKNPELPAKHPANVDPDIYRATQGREARVHYERIRGFIPK